MKRNVRKSAALLISVAMLVTMLFSVVVLPQMLASAAEESPVIVTKEDINKMSVAPNEPATPSNPYFRHYAANPPQVSTKVDLLQAAGWGDNYPITSGFEEAGHMSGSDPVLFDNVNLTETPYLYYSIQQPENSSCTFGFTLTFNVSPRVDWFLFRDGADTSGSVMSDQSNELTKNWMNHLVQGSETGCWDIRDFQAFSTDNFREPLINRLQPYFCSTIFFCGK